MRILKTLIGGVAATLIATAAQAAEHTLTIASWAPPTHGMNAAMWPNLTKMIEEAGPLRLGSSRPRTNGT